MAVGETLTIFAAGLAAASPGNEMPDPAMVAAQLGVPENQIALIEATSEQALPAYLDNTNTQTSERFSHLAQEGGGDDDWDAGYAFASGPSKEVSMYDSEENDYGSVSFETTFSNDKSQDFLGGVARNLFETYIKVNLNQANRDNPDYNGIFSQINPQDFEGFELVKYLQITNSGTNGVRFSLDMNGVMAYVEESQSGGMFSRLNNYVGFGLKDKLEDRFPVLENRTGQVRNGLRIAFLSLSGIATCFIAVNKVASYVHKRRLKKKGIRISKP